MRAAHISHDKNISIRLSNVDIENIRKIKEADPETNASELVRQFINELTSSDAIQTKYTNYIKVAKLRSDIKVSSRLFSLYDREFALLKQLQIKEVNVSEYVRVRFAQVAETLGDD